MSASALELRAITRHFGDLVALDDANLTARPGTVHALLGENGAGKTTLMRVAYGIIAPTSGSILVGGTERSFASPAAAIRAGIGMVQQHSANVPAMTVWENVVLGGRGRIRPSETREHVRSLAARLGFQLDPDSVVGNLSVAGQQRLEILKAVYHEATILILDEPTAILAPRDAAELYEWLRTFAANGGTAIVVTHKLDEARRYTDELTVLRGGRTVLTAKSESVPSDELTRAMIGEALPGAQRGTSPRAGGVVLSAKGLRVARDNGTTAIDGATLEIRAGEIVGVAGVEGSGHHELLLAVAGRAHRDGGTLTRPDSVSLVPEDRHRDAVILTFTLVENAALRGAGERSGRVAWSQMADTTRDQMTRFDVRAPGPSAVMRALSGGNQQKFVLARELSGSPELIVAENPTRGLDIRASAFVREQLREARNHGAAVLLYSSDLDEIMEIADRVIVVHAGKVSEPAFDRGAIGAAMLGAT